MLRRLVVIALTLAVSLSTLSSAAYARGFASPPPFAPRKLVIDETRMETRPILTAPMRAELKAVLSARRAKNVAAFRRYAQRGVYPHNFVVDGPLNVWIDEEGRMCAAATMIFRSGAKSLVRKVAREDNYIRLGAVAGGPLLDWMLTSGLTQHEIATIQEPFMGRMEPIEPAPAIAKTPRQLEDERLAARYREVLAMLAAGTDASLDAAIDRLATRPDLIATLIR
jgi:hypothetical protein